MFHNKSLAKLNSIKCWIFGKVIVEEPLMTSLLISMHILVSIGLLPPICGFCWPNLIPPMQKKMSSCNCSLYSLFESSRLCVIVHNNLTITIFNPFLQPVVAMEQKLMCTTTMGERRETASMVARTSLAMP
jgi:hypothetical protein